MKIDRVFLKWILAEGIIFLFMVISSFGTSYEWEDIFSNSKVILLIIDPETGQIVDANSAATNFYGYEVGQLKKMRINQINTLSEEEIKLEMQNAVSEDRNYFVFKHMLSNGSIRDVEVYSYPTKTESGGEVLFSVIHDITDKMMAERESQRNRNMIILSMTGMIISLSIMVFGIQRSKKSILSLKERYQKLFDHMKEGFAIYKLVVDETGEAKNYVFLEGNDAFEKMTGFTIKELKGKQGSEFLSELDPYLMEKYKNVVDTEINQVFSIYQKDADKFFHVSVYSPEKGQFAIIFRDITSMKKLESALMNERMLFKTTLESLTDAVIATNEKKEIYLINPMAEKLSGWNIEEIRGKSFDSVFKIFRGENKELMSSTIEDVIGLGENIIFPEPVFLERKNKEQLIIEISMSPLYDENQSIVGAVVVFRDYSQKKAKEDEILFLSYHDQLTGIFNLHSLKV